MNRRCALAATLYGRAEALALQMYDDACLIPAWLRGHRAAQLTQQALLVRQAVAGTPREDAGTHEAAALDTQALELLQNIIAVIERRTAAGTMVREREMSMGEGSERGARRLRGLDSLTLLHPEVWHVPRGGSGVLQARDGGCTVGKQWAYAPSPNYRPCFASYWLRPHNLGGSRRYSQSASNGIFGCKRASAFRSLCALHCRLDAGHCERVSSMQLPGGTTLRHFN